MDYIVIDIPPRTAKEFCKTILQMIRDMPAALSPPEKAVYVARVYRYIEEHLEWMTTGLLDRFVVCVEQYTYATYMDPTLQSYTELIERCRRIHTHLVAYLKTLKAPPYQKKWKDQRPLKDSLSHT